MTLVIIKEYDSTAILDRFQKIEIFDWTLSTCYTLKLRVKLFNENVEIILLPKMF